MQLGVLDLVVSILRDPFFGLHKRLLCSGAYKNMKNIHMGRTPILGNAHVGSYEKSDPKNHLS